jgi:putative tricarboxylic transport membrane protein
MRGGIAKPEALIGLGLLLYAGLALWQVGQIPVSPLYAKVEPTIFPYITVAGLAALAVLLLVQAVRGGWQPAEEAEVRLDWPALGFVVAGLVANVALIGLLGFTLASTLLFALVAHGFGSRTPVRNAAIGFAIALLAYFGFAKALGVNIGAGLIEGLLGG